jgi:hypothetical protein
VHPDREPPDRRRPAGPPAFVSHQRDDDTDGRGNACDFDYDQFGAVVTAVDFNHMKASIGKLMTAATCGTVGAMRCGKFDHDGAGATVTAVDFNAVKASIGKVPAAKCAACAPPFSPIIGAGAFVGAPVCQGPPICCGAVCP